MVRSGLSGAQARRALEDHRRGVRRYLGNEIGTLEDTLRWIVEGWLPVRRPRPRTVEWDLASGLRGDDNRVLRIGGLAVVHRSAGVGMDELVDALRDQYRMPHVRPERVVQRFGDDLRMAQRLRGRGGYYGAIRNGVAADVLARLGHDQIDQWLATGMLPSTAQQLHGQLVEALERPVESDYVDVLRSLYFWLADHAAADQTFAEVFLGLPLIGVVMADPRRPRWCTWQQLASDYLGVRPNVGAAGLGS